MEQDLNEARRVERSMQRDALVAAIGDSALLLVALSEPADLQEALKEWVGTKPNSRRGTELFPTIATLGSQTLHAVDLVLSIQDMVDQYKDRHDILVTVIEDEMVPQYLSAVAKGADESTRAALRAIWREIRDERYPKPQTRYEELMTRKKRFNTSNSSSLTRSRNGRHRPK